jgi:hypothetical protein
MPEKNLKRFEITLDSLGQSAIMATQTERRVRKDESNTHDVWGKGNRMDQ